jgi:pimeloyl-ACP methyl ester carboxylesterase
MSSAGSRRAEAAKAPLVLMHDSLGSVDLWREFPAQLAAATGREVIAYDRLGFGHSDPNPHRLQPSFVETRSRPASRRFTGRWAWAIS